MGLILLLSKEFNCHTLGGQVFLVVHMLSLRYDFFYIYCPCLTFDVF